MKPTIARTRGALLLLAASLWAGSALAQEQQLIENTVVRNRLHTPGGRFEVSPSFGATLLTHLTSHYSLNVAVAYNFVSSLALEGRVGWAYSRQTGLARDVADQFLAERKATTNDLQDLWQMGLHGAVGVRWAPIYGKLSLMAEVPAHFQAYVWGGGGLAQQHRQSVVMCSRVVNAQQGICDNRTNAQDRSSASENFFLKEDRVAPIGSAAVGLRFFVGDRQGIRLEVRDWFFRDSYRVNVERAAWEAGQPTGTPASSPGLTHIVQLDLGYTFLF
jgi:outer membrane beta-barrel protein